MGQRVEPLIYWTVEGDRITTTAFSMRLTELRYAAMNRIPDGMLVRISSIDQASDRANQIQTAFANEMVAAIDPPTRQRFLGLPIQN
jgi:EpsI family protein